MRTQNNSITNCYMFGLWTVLAVFQNLWTVVAVSLVRDSVVSCQKWQQTTREQREKGSRTIAACCLKCLTFRISPHEIQCGIIVILFRSAYKLTTSPAVNGILYNQNNYLINYALYFS